MPWEGGGDVVFWTLSELLPHDIKNEVEERREIEGRRSSGWGELKIGTGFFGKTAKTANG